MRGRLYAFGTNAETNHWQPTIAVSDDGATWRVADVPPWPWPSNADVVDMIDAGDRLVALARATRRIGSRFDADVRLRTTTAIYVSSDTETWQLIDEPLDDNVQGRLRVDDLGPVFSPNVGAYSLLKSGERVLALGQNVWASTDAGLSWFMSTKLDEAGGIYDPVEQDGLIVAVGFGLSARKSLDGGDTWISQDLPHIADTAFPAVKTIGMDGKIVVLGWNAHLNRLVVWTCSVDRGATWDAVRTKLSGQVQQVVAVPGGYVATGDPQGSTDLAGGRLWTSTDGTSWTADQIEMWPFHLAWTPTFGMVATGVLHQRGDFGNWMAIIADPVR